MKVIFAIAFMAVIGCNDAAKEEPMRIAGAYTMLSQVINDGTKDTTFLTLKQLKIFTDNYMMYANVNPADSVSGFGVGTYTVDSGMVEEHVIYSASDTSASNEAAHFKLQIEKTANGYKQIIPEITGRNNQKLKLTETYETVGTNAKTPLDGVWKEIQRFTLKGKDTVINKSIQYKCYAAGHFMFGHTYTDSTKKLHTGIGYGTFEMNSSDKVKENVQASTYYQIKGKSFDIDIEMNGADAYKQTITNADGSKDVELYQRLKN